MKMDDHNILWVDIINLWWGFEKAQKNKILLFKVLTYIWWKIHPDNFEMYDLKRHKFQKFVFLKST